MAQTLNCVRCLKPAKFWTGHVRNIKTNTDIIANWWKKIEEMIK